MAEVTHETFRKAARKAVINLDEGSGDGDERTSFRERVRSLLVSKGVEAPDVDLSLIAEGVADKIQKMIFHKEELEVRRKAAERRIEQRAMEEFLRMMAEEEEPTDG